MDDYNNAIQSFIKMKEYTESVGEKVKACHLIATIYGKRLNNIDGAKEYIQNGMNIAQNSDDFRTLYEKGWLYNYVAYVSYSLEKDFDKALNYVNQAVEFLKPFKNYTPDSKIMDEIGNPISAERLLGNLTANISYLYFYKGDYQQALEAFTFLKLCINSLSTLRSALTLIRWIICISSSIKLSVISALRSQKKEDSSV